MTKDRKVLLGELAFILGIAVFPFLKWELWISFFLAGLAVVLIILFEDEKARILLLIILFFIAGVVRFGLVSKKEPSDVELEALNGKKMELECRVAAMPETKNTKQQVVLEVEDGQAFEGKILAYASAYGDYDYGDKITFEGKLKIPENFEDFDYRGYLRGKGIYLVSYYPKLEKSGDNEGGMRGAIYDFRKGADEKILKIMPSPQAGIVSAMTLGTRSPEIEEVMEKFNQTGTSHVIAVSGYHLVIVVAVLMFFLLSIGVNRGSAFYWGVLGIIFYVILSGSSASAVRSGIMAFVFLLSVKVGRGGHVWNALIFSAALMIFANPYILTNDVGFQLSFLATFGLIAILPYLNKRCGKLPNLGGVKTIFLTTLAAQLAVFPILILNFGQFSVLSFLANILILPSVPVLMGLGFSLIGISCVSLTLARIIAFPAYLLVSYEIGIVDMLARIDWGMIKF